MIVEKEPSSLPLGGYLLGSLLSIVPIIFASGSVLRLTIMLAEPKTISAPIGSVVVTLLAPLLVAGSLFFYWSSRRYRYAAPGIGATVLILAIWFLAMAGSVLISFGDPFLEINVEPDLIQKAHVLAQSSLWVYVCILTVNVGSSTLVDQPDGLGRVARVLFLASTILFGILTTVPAAASLLVSG